MQICKEEATIRIKKANGNVVLLPEENVIVCVEKKVLFLEEPYQFTEKCFL